MVRTGSSYLLAPSSQALELAKFEMAEMALTGRVGQSVWCRLICNGIVCHQADIDCINVRTVF